MVEIESAGVPVLLENSWESSPDIIIDILTEVDKIEAETPFEATYVIYRTPFDIRALPVQLEGAKAAPK